MYYSILEVTFCALHNLVAPSFIQGLKSLLAIVMDNALLVAVVAVIASIAKLENWSVVWQTLELPSRVEMAVAVNILLSALNANIQSA